MNKIGKVLKKQKGFTLIELLIVIAIIGVLAVLIIPRVMTSLDDAKTNTSDTNIKLVQSAVERYTFDHEGQFPTSDGTGGTSATPISIDFTKLVGKYMDAEPANPTSYKLVDGVIKVTGS